MTSMERQLARYQRTFGCIPKHAKVAFKALKKLGQELSERNIKYLEDPTWPFHLIIFIGNSRWSFYCSGFRDIIEIQKLTPSGIANKRFKEKSFSTAVGAANYAKRLLKK